MADYFQVKNQNIFNPPANTNLGNATNQFNDVYVQSDLILGNVTVTGDTIIAPRVTTITYPGDDTAADTAGGQTITLVGTGFVAGANILINGSAVGVVSVISSTTITFTSPANATGSYVIYVINPDGSTAIAIPGIQYSGTPNWTTAAGTLGNVYETASFTQTVTATGDAPITYSVASGSIPPGATFNANGTITGTSQLSSSPTTYSFTVRATDAEQQDTDRAFSIAVIPDVVTWSNPTNNATYTPAANIAIANITLSATSAVGSGITYSANTLPTGLSLTGANITGTPTVAANTSSLLTATANTTSESSSITINWVVSVASDPYFMYNSLLLPGTGTNGAQNNTFLDGSTNNFAITRAGNTTQGTFSPYGPNWSNYFDGATSTRLTLPSNVAFAFGTGAYTVEAWVNITAFGTQSTIFDAGAANNAWDLAVASNGAISIGKYGVGPVVNSSILQVALNSWVHVAAVRSSTATNDTKIYANGVLVGTGTDSNNWTVTTTPSIAGYNLSGYSMNGYISNLRIVKGTAVYTSAFTPSTTPLTAIANTSLLTCQSNRFIDNSSNALVLTVSGAPTIQRFSPFSPTQAYSTSTIGGSGYFDGTGDYLSAANNAALNLGTGDFTLEAWIYVTSFSGSGVILDKRTTIGTVAPWVWYTDTDGKLNFYTGTNYITTSSFSLNTWTHIVTSRVSGTLYQFINGVSAMTPTSVTANIDTSGTLLIGTSNDSAPVYTKGYIADLRIVKGSGVTSVTVPTSPLTAISGTSLLLSATNAGIIDNTMINNLETVGNAQISTAQTKFGGGSMSFDGTGDYLNAIPNIAFTYGAGSFTIEGWHYLTAASTVTKYLFDQRVSGNGYFPALYVSGGQYIVYINSAVPLTAGTVASNVWVHWALVKNSATSTTTLCINGTQAGSFVDTNNYSATAQFRVGSEFNSSGLYDWQGYMDDIRITKGYARYSTYSATTSNTTASSIRSGSSLAGFFGSYGVFNTTAAGQYLLVDFGVSVSNIQTTYLNYNGGQWAPTSVLIQTSNDNSTWSTVVTYSDNNTNTLQTIASTGSGRYWRIYQNSATRQNSAGYEWHLGSFTMTNSFTPPIAALPTY